MFPLSCHRGPCCLSLHTQGRQGDKLPSRGTSAECFKSASARSLQAQEHLLCCCAHLVFSSPWQRQSSLLSSLWWQLHVALRPLTCTLDLKAEGFLSAERGSQIWKRVGVVGGRAVEKGWCAQARGMVAQLQKVIKILVSAEWSGSQETGHLPSRLCLESQNNLG